MHSVKTPSHLINLQVSSHKVLENKSEARRLTGGQRPVVPTGGSALNVTVINVKLIYMCSEKFVENKSEARKLAGRHRTVVPPGECIY